MGSCISKCKTKTKRKKPHQECTKTSSHVQDKLVISQAPLIMSPTPPTLRNLALCPSPTPSSSSSFSNSFSSASKNNDSELTTSSLSSSSSLVLCSKDRSFSNEFLWSCAKENPQIIGLDSIKHHILHAGKLNARTKPNVAPVKESNIPKNHRLVRSTTQKRARSGSPTLTRQKSFRVEPERTNSASSRNLRSPNSRRFNVENCGHRSPVISTYNSTKESHGGKRSVNSARKENVVRPASPSNRLSITRDQSFLRNGERFGRKIKSKADEFGIKEDMLMDISMENIENPLIALDCFIFL